MKSQPGKRRPAWRYVLFAALALLTINAVALFAFTRPRLERSRRALELSAKLATKLADERGEYDRLRRRADILAANQRDARRFFAETAVPMPAGMAADRKTIREAQLKAGLPDGPLQFSRQPVPDAPLTRVNIHLTTTGTRSQASSFLRSIETSPRFLIIDRVRLRAERERERVSLEVDLSAFYRSEGDATARKAASRR